MKRDLLAKMLANPEIYFKTAAIGELYFRFIKHTELEAKGWTAKALAEKLEGWGFIKILIIQYNTASGHFSKGHRVYHFLPGKQITKKDLVQLILTKCPRPPSFFERVFKKESV